MSCCRSSIQRPGWRDPAETATDLRQTAVSVHSLLQEQTISHTLPRKRRRCKASASKLKTGPYSPPLTVEASGADDPTAWAAAFCTSNSETAVETAIKLRAANMVAEGWQPVVYNERFRFLCRGNSCNCKRQRARYNFHC